MVPAHASRLSLWLRSPWRWTVVVIAAGVGWRLLRWGLNFPLWGDEGFTAVNFLTRDYGQMMEGLDHAQVVSLGMLWSTLTLTKLLGDTEWVLRLFSLFSGIVGLFLFVWWAPRVVSRRSGYAAAMILAASYYPVRHGAEVKPYAGDLLVATGVLIAAWWVQQAPRELRRWAGYAGVIGLGVWFSYPSFFVAAGTGVALMIGLARGRELRGSATAWAGAIGAAATLVVSSLVMWKVFGVIQHGANAILAETEYWALGFPPSLFEGWGGVWGWPVRFVLWFLEVHTGNMMAYPAGGKDAGSIVTFVLFMAGIVTLWRRQPGVLSLMLWPMGMCFIAACLAIYPYGSSPRTMQSFVPTICLLSGVGLMGLLRWRGGAIAAARGLRVTAIVMVVVIGIGMVGDVRKPYKKLEDEVARDLMIDLMATSAPDTRWVVVGSLQGRGWAPEMIGYGGRWARNRHYLIREAREQGIDLQFAPDPTTLKPHDGDTVLVTYWHLYIVTQPYPEALIASYLAAAQASLRVEPVVEERLILDGVETLTLYNFHTRGGSGGSDKDVK